MAHTVPHPLGQLPGQKYVSLALQAGGVHIGANVSVGGIGSGERVGGTGDVGTNKVHARSARSTGMADNRFIMFSLLMPMSVMNIGHVVVHMLLFRMFMFMRMDTIHDIVRMGEIVMFVAMIVE